MQGAAKFDHVDKHQVSKVSAHFLLQFDVHVLHYL